MDKEAKVKSWEKPWRTDEIRDQSSKWNLAGDAGLLKTLEQFAEDLNTRSNSTLKKLNALGNDLDRTSSDISNVTNTFLSLSNKQFFENRVKDDDESTGGQKSEDKPDEKTKPEPSDPKERVREALTKGMEFLDTMFSSVELVVGSDSEEEDSLTSAGHLLKPINPYTNRPLPCVIGSREFFEDDHVGLRPLSEEEEEEEEEEDLQSVQSSDSENNKVLLLPSDRLQRNKISTPSESENSQPESEQSGVPEKKKKQHHSHGQESPPEAEVAAVPLPPTSPQTTTQKSFAAELAAKLGGVAAADTHAAKEKPDIYAQTRKHFDDLFGPPSDDEDDSLFGSGGKYSGGRGLFDDDDDDDNDDPEDWKKPPRAKEPQKSAVAKPKDVPPKVPAIAIPNTDNLFGSEDVDHGIFSSPKLTADTRAPNEAETVDVTKNGEVKTSTPNQQSSDSLPGLMDHFHNVSAIQAVPRPQSDQSSSPFGNTTEGLRTKDSGVQSDASAQTTFKKPAGGVSIFGNMAVNASMLASKLQSSSKELTAGNVAVLPGSSTSGVDTNNTVSRSPRSNNSGSSSAGLQQQQQQQGESPSQADADQLFNKGTHTHSNVTSATTKKQPVSLFDDLDSDDDDDDDLLFSSTGSAGSRSRQSVDVVENNRKSQQQQLTKRNVFDDDVDLFGGALGGGGGSDFDIFAAKGERNKVVLKEDDDDDWLTGGSSAKATSSENLRDKKNKKDSTKVDDMSWLDDADTGDIFSDLNTKAQVAACKEPTLHSGDLFSDKLFEDEEDAAVASSSTVVTPKPRSNAEVAAKGAPEPAKLSENAQVPRPVAVARTALPKNVQDEKPTVAPRKTAGAAKAKEVVVKSDDPGDPPSTSEKHEDDSSSTRESVRRDDGDSLNKDAQVRPQVKPDPPKTLNIRRQTTGNSLLDDGPVEDSSTLPEDTTDDAASASMRGPKDDALVANVTDKTAGGDKVKLNIDPLALLPGAKPPTRAERLLDKAAASLDEPPAPPPADPVVATLPSAAKDRVKIQVKRRPQTRRARQEAIRASLIENEGDGSVGDFPSEVPQPKTSLLVTEPEDQAQTLRTAETCNPRLLLLPSSNPLSPSTDEEDFFGVPPDLPPDYGNSRDAADCNGSLFGDAPVLSPLNLGSVHAFSQNLDDPLLEKSGYADSFDDVPDLFGQKTSKTLEDLFPAVKNEGDVDGNRNTFGGDGSHVTSAASSKLSSADPTENGNVDSGGVPVRNPLLEKSRNTGADSFDDVPDLFGQKPTGTYKTLEDLFPAVKKDSSSAVTSALFDPTENGNVDSRRRTPAGRDPLLEKLGADSLEDVPDLFGGQKGTRTSKTLEDLFPAIEKEGDSSQVKSAASFDPIENGDRESRRRTPAPAGQDPLLEKSAQADDSDDISDLFGQKAARKSKTLQDLFPTVKKESALKSEDNSLFRGSQVVRNHPPRLFSGSDEDDGDLFSTDKSRTSSTDKTKEVKPVPKFFTNSSKSSSDFRPPASKTKVSKGADSKSSSVHAMAREEEKLFSEDRQTRITSAVSDHPDEDNLFSSSAGKSDKKAGVGSSLFGDDSPESEDLFGNVSSSSSASKKVVSTKTAAVSESRTTQQIKPAANKLQRSIFDDDDDDEDIFSKQSSKSSSSSNVSQSILGASADPYDLFASFPASKPVPGGGSKVQKQQHGGGGGVATSRIKVNEKGDVFEDPLMALKK